MKFYHLIAAFQLVLFVGQANAEECWSGSTARSSSRLDELDDVIKDRNKCAILTADSWIYVFFPSKRVLVICPPEIPDTKANRALLVSILEQCSLDVVQSKKLFRNLFHFKNYFESNFDYLNCDQGVNEDTVWFKGVKNVDTDISAVKGYQCSLVDLTGRKKCECAPKSPKGDHPRIARASIRFQ